MVLITLGLQKYVEQGLVRIYGWEEENSRGQIWDDELWQLWDEEREKNNNTCICFTFDSVVEFTYILSHSQIVLLTSVFLVRSKDSLALLM